MMYETTMPVASSTMSQYRSVSTIAVYVNVGETCAKLAQTLITQLRIPATAAEFVDLAMEFKVKSDSPASFPE